MYVFRGLSSDVVVVVSPTQNGACPSLFTVDLKGWTQLEWEDGWIYPNNSGPCRVVTHFWWKTQKCSPRPGV